MGQKLNEHEEQRSVILWANTMAIRQPVLKLLFAVPNAARRSFGAANYMRAEGLKRGVPDLFLPCARGGYHGLFIEMKVKPNKPSPEQVEYIRELNAQSYHALICWSASEAITNIEKYLGM
jgi:hypothetical protein